MPFIRRTAIVIAGERGFYEHCYRSYRASGKLAGDAAFTLTEPGAEISRQSLNNIGYVNLSEAECKNVLMKAGLPEVLAVLYTDSGTGISKGGLFDDRHH